MRKRVFNGSNGEMMAYRSRNNGEVGIFRDRRNGLDRRSSVLQLREVGKERRRTPQDRRNFDTQQSGKEWWLKVNYVTKEIYSETRPRRARP